MFLTTSEITKRCFKKWREKYPDEKCPNREELRKAIDKCTREIKKKLYLGHNIILPARLGTLTIRHKPLEQSLKEKQPIDWKASKKLGKKVRHNNFLTEGKIYRLYWYTDVSRKILNKYFFVPCEAFNIGIADAIKKGRVWPER